MDGHDFLLQAIQAKAAVIVYGAIAYWMGAVNPDALKALFERGDA